MKFIFISLLFFRIAVQKEVLWGAFPGQRLLPEEKGKLHWREDGCDKRYFIGAFSLGNAAAQGRYKNTPYQKGSH